MTVKHEERAHSPLGASSAHRWMSCPGSIRLSAHLPDRPSRYADEGTAAHELAERCLRSGADAIDHLGETITVRNQGYAVDDEMAEAVQVYLDAVRADYEDGDLLFIEVRFHLSHLHPLMFGTGDCALYKVKTGKLIVYDYKHGQGHTVEVVRNPQLIYYGIGAVTSDDLRNLPITDVELVVAQPRGRGEPVKRWTTDVMDLLAFSGDLVKAAKATEQPDAPLAAGSWCKFCPAAGTCPELREQALRDAQDDFADAPEDMPLDVLAGILRRADLIEQWVKSVRAEVYRRAREGDIIPGFKFVAKRARRAWLDPNEAAAHLRLAHGLHPTDLFTDPVLRSPAQLEKLLPKPDRQSLAPFITANSTGVSLVSVNDKRPAVPAPMSAEDDFND